MIGQDATLELLGDRSVVNIAFIEDDGLDSKTVANYRDRYDYVWLTKPIERKDPCVDLQFGKPSS